MIVSSYDSPRLAQPTDKCLDCFLHKYLLLLHVKVNFLSRNHFEGLDVLEANNIAVLGCNINHFLSAHENIFAITSADIIVGMV